jgi:hypothetical protein
MFDSFRGIAAVALERFKTFAPSISKQLKWLL